MATHAPMRQATNNLEMTTWHDTSLTRAPTPAGARRSHDDVREHSSTAGRPPIGTDDDDMTQITTTTCEHVAADDAYADAREVAAQDWSEDYTGRHIREIADGSALAIAALWQSPGSVGRHLATLASVGTVGLTELLDDIAATRAGVSGPDDMRALDCLATWALNHPSRNGR